MAKKHQAGMANRRSKAGDFLMFFILLLLGAFMLLPMLFSLIQSLKPMSEMYQFPPKFYTLRPTLDSYRSVFSLMSSMWVPFSRYLFNSLFVTVAATGMHLLFAAMAAYPLAKHQFPGKDFIFGSIMLALMFVSQVLFVPSFIINVKLGFLDTYYAYIFPSVGASIGLFLLRQFMMQLPDALLEAARIDGASEYLTFFKIVLPNVKPAIYTVAIFQFVGVWNGTPQDMVYTESLKIVRVALDQIGKSDANARYGPAMAASVLLMIPPVVVFLLFQRNVVETMTQAGIKG